MKADQLTLQCLDRLNVTLEQRIQKLAKFIAIPSISTDPAYRNECRAAAAWLLNFLDDIGFKSELIETPGLPIVHSQYRSPSRIGQLRRHVLFYAHYDVQPPDPIEHWHTEPFAPAILSSSTGVRKIVGRGAADDKGQLLTFLMACEVWIEVYGELPLDLDIIIEGEEEIGSPNIGFYLDNLAMKSDADVIFACDTNMWDEKTPAIVTSLRGLVQGEVILTCASRDFHSGIYGGAAENAALVLCRLLGQLKSPDGKVRIRDFYTNIIEPPASLWRQWQDLGHSCENFLEPVGLGRSAGEFDRHLIEQIQS